MKKWIKIIIIFFIAITTFILYGYNQRIKEINKIKVSGDIGKIVQVQIIDKDNSIEKIHENYKEEKYEVVDMIIDGNYYHNVGIRTKGSAIYSYLKYHNSDRHSYKIKLDYIHADQKYKGMTEIHLNTNVMDDTGFREYIAYKVYNEMDVETQSYGLGDLSIGKEHIGLITIIEVINEEYIFNKYNSKDGNLYKPDSIGTDMQYKDDEINTYKGIFNNTKTVNTDNEDKQRLISIFKKLKEAKTTKEIEENFIDFDRIIRSVAINKAIGNVDNFTGKSRRNFYLYEENGKIDIIPYDFNISFGMYPEESVFTEEDANDIELTEYKYQVHSIIVDLIMENEEYLEKYNLYLQKTINKLEEMKNQGVIDEIENNVSEIIKNTENEFYTYEEHQQEVEKLKEFIENRVNMIQMQNKENFEKIAY